MDLHSNLKLRRYITRIRTTHICVTRNQGMLLGFCAQLEQVNFSTSVTPGRNDGSPFAMNEHHIQSACCPEDLSSKVLMKAFPISDSISWVTTLLPYFWKAILLVVRVTILPATAANNGMRETGMPPSL